MKTNMLLKPRFIIYSALAFVVIAVNANAVAAPVTASFEYWNSHRHQNAVKYGQWDTTNLPSPVNAVHAALLRTGKVLLIAGSGNNQTNFDNKSFKSVIWDPADNSFTNIPTPWDAFCSGHVFLPDGRLLVAGGTRKYEDLTKTPKQEYEGLPDSYLFDPVTERYIKVDDMKFSRWYPTLVGLSDGRILSSSGLDDKGKLVLGNTEIFDPTTQKWALQPQLNHTFPTYPSLLLSADGRLFFTGSNAGYGSATQGRAPGLWNLTNNTFQTVPGLTDADMLETSASLMLPPAQAQRVMVLGGGGVGDSQKSTDRTAITTLSDTAPTYTAGPKLSNPIRYLSTVILPDDTVLATGGSTGYRTNNVLSASILHTDTNTFSHAASPTVGRNYHSEALLLPDGRVATFGSNPIDNSFETRIEIYSPSYLFKGNRPKIISGKTSFDRGSTTTFKTSTSSELVNAKLIRPSAVTHVTDVEQRSIDLPMTKTSDGISVQIPDNANLVPSGWYMMFVSNTQNVPSQAYWVHVN